MTLYSCSTVPEGRSKKLKKEKKIVTLVRVFLVRERGEVDLSYTAESQSSPEMTETLEYFFGYLGYYDWHYYYYY